MEKKRFELTDGQLNSLKNKHGEVYEICVKDDEGNDIIGIFKKPDMKIIGASQKFASDDPIKSGLVLFDNCWLDGDNEMKTNDEYKLSAIAGIGKLFKVRQEEIKKL